MLCLSAALMTAADSVEGQHDLVIVRAVAAGRWTGDSNIDTVLSQLLRLRQLPLQLSLQQVKLPQRLFTATAASPAVVTAAMAASPTVTTVAIIVAATAASQ